MKNIINITEIKERVEKLSLNEVIDEMNECEQIVDDSFIEPESDELDEEATIKLAETLLTAFYLETQRRLLIANM